MEEIICKSTQSAEQGEQTDRGMLVIRREGGCLQLLMFPKHLSAYKVFFPSETGLSRQPGLPNYRTERTASSRLIVRTDLLI